MSTISRAFLRAVGIAVLAAVALPAAACSSSSSSKSPQENRVQVTAKPTTVEMGSAPNVDGGRLLLHLDDFRVAEGEGAILRLFVNRPDATAATPREDAGFVDELILVPARSRATAPGARAPGQNLVLPLPSGVAKPGERLTLTLIPVGTDAEGRLTQPGTVDVTLERPYVTVER